MSAHLIKARNLITLARDTSRNAHRQLTAATPPFVDVPLPIAEATEAVAAAYHNLAIALRHLELQAADELRELICPRCHSHNIKTATDESNDRTARCLNCTCVWTL